MLYPIKFKPIFKERVWGGDRLLKAGKRLPAGMRRGVHVGESWEISGLDGDLSVASTGFLRSNDISELIEVYMGELVGDGVYDKYGLEFPVLVKFIDAADVLSVQVHPDDALAEERHGCRGKTEMWYVVDCKPGASLYVGFDRPVSRQEYVRAVIDGTVTDLLRKYEVCRGDVFHIPAGTIHAVGGGILLAEIQETSDVTYRISDWGRVGTDGKPRQLHIAQAVDAIDFDCVHDYRIHPEAEAGRRIELLSTPFFDTGLIKVDGECRMDYSSLDSFVAYICTEGDMEVSTEGGKEHIGALECLLVPAEADWAVLRGRGTVVEVHM